MCLLHACLVIVSKLISMRFHISSKVLQVISYNFNFKLKNSGVKCNFKLKNSGVRCNFKLKNAGVKCNFQIEVHHTHQGSLIECLLDV